MESSFVIAAALATSSTDFTGCGKSRVAQPLLAVCLC
jgi:hypothetical protein